MADRRRVLITGGASGLGAALAARFVERGDRVLITDLAESVEVPGGASYLRLDVRSQDDWIRARDWSERTWGGLDMLVNNAGVAAGGRIDVVGLDVWQWIIDINLLGVVRGCRTFVPLFKEQGSGHIVNIASMAGLVHAPGMASYNASKAGVVALSETLQYELEPFGITTSAVCPTFFRTNLVASLPGADPLLDAIAARLVSRAPASAEEIAAAVMRGIDARRAVIITDRPGLIAFWSKRLFRPLYDHRQRQFAAMIRAAAQGSTRAAERATLIP